MVALHRAAVCAALLLLVLPCALWAAEEMKCPDCGRLYPASTTYCMDDGTRLVRAVETCARCGAERVGQARFCGSCGRSFEPPRSEHPPVASEPSRPPAERTCPSCGRKAQPGVKFCSGCGRTLPAPTPGREPSGTTGPEPAAGDGQWASAVVGFSSQMGTRNFSAEKALGPPDVVRAGKDGNGWAPNLGRRGIEWITVRFPRPVIPRAVRIYETVATGFVTRVDVIEGGREVLFWEAEDRATPEARILEAASTVETGPIDTVKVTIDTKKVRKWVEIDAIELIAGTGRPGRRQGLERMPPREREPERSDPPVVERPQADANAGLRFGSPDACFDSWKKAILARDAAALAECYVLLERATIEQESDVAQAIFARYRDGLRRDDYRVDSRRNDVGGEFWVVEMSVRDGSLTHRVRETFRFRREAGAWRLQVERGG